MKFCTDDFLHEYVGTDMSFPIDEARCIRIDLTKKDICLTLFERMKKSLDTLDFKYFASQPLVRDARFVQVIHENWHEQQYSLAIWRNRKKSFLDIAISARNDVSGESLLVSSLDFPFYEQSSTDSRSLADWVIRHKKWKDFRKENMETSTRVESLVFARCCKENWEEVYMSLVEHIKITSLTSVCLFEAIRSGSRNITKDILSVLKFPNEVYERALEEALSLYTRDMVQERRDVLEEVVKFSKVSPLLSSLAKSGHEKSLGVVLQILRNDVNKIWSAEGPILFLLIEYNLGNLVEMVLRNFSLDLYAEFRGELCIHKAAELGRLKIMEVLHDVDQTLLVKPNKWGKTPLHLSSYKGHVHCVNFLLAQDVDVDVKDITGKTPLHYAAYLAGAQVTYSLLEKGADLDIEDDNGDTAIDIARRYKHDRVEKTLQRRISHPCDRALAAIKGLFES